MLPDVIAVYAVVGMEVSAEWRRDDGGEVVFVVAVVLASVDVVGGNTGFTDFDDAVDAAPATLVSLLARPDITDATAA